MSAFKSLADIKPLPIWEGILARVCEGREMTFAVAELDAGAVAARHQHPNEQVGPGSFSRARSTSRSAANVASSTRVIPTSFRLACRTKPLPALKAASSSDACLRRLATTGGTMNRWRQSRRSGRVSVEGLKVRN